MWTHPLGLREVSTAEPLLHPPVWIHWLTFQLSGVTQQNDRQRSQPPLTGTRGEWGHSDGLHVAVEGTMIAGEELVMVQVTRPAGPEEGHDQSAALTPHPTGSLDVGCGGLGLAVNHHQAQSINVHASAEH